MHISLDACLYSSTQISTQRCATCTSFGSHTDDYLTSSNVQHYTCSSLCHKHKHMHKHKHTHKHTHTHTHTKAQAAEAYRVPNQSTCLSHLSAGKAAASMLPGSSYRGWTTACFALLCMQVSAPLQHFGRCHRPWQPEAGHMAWPMSSLMLAVLRDCHTVQAVPSSTKTDTQSSNNLRLTRCSDAMHAKLKDPGNQPMALPHCIGAMPQCPKTIEALSLKQCTMMQLVQILQSSNLPQCQGQLYCPDLTATHPKGAEHRRGVRQPERKLLLDACSCPCHLHEITNQPSGHLLSKPQTRHP